MTLKQDQKEPEGSTWIVQANGLCLWVRPFEDLPNTQESIQRLHEYGAVRVQEDETTLLALQSRIQPIWQIIDGDNHTNWAPSQSLKKVKKAPVILANILDIGGLCHDFGIENTGNALILSCVLPIPNTQFGLIGGIENIFYRIDELGEEAISLQKRMAGKLTEIATPVGWQIYQASTATKDSVISMKLPQSMTEIKAWHARKADNPEQYQQSIQDVANMATNLADMYWQHHINSAHTGIQDAFINGRAPVLLVSVFQAVSLAINTAVRDRNEAKNKKTENLTPHWGINNGVPTYLHKSEDSETQVQIRPDDLPAVIDDEMTRSLRSLVSQLNDTDRRFLIALIAHSTVVGGGENEVVWITSEMILNDCGIKKKQGDKKKSSDERTTHGYREEDYLNVAASMDRLQQIWITSRQNLLVNMPQKNKRRTTRREWTTHEGRLITISERQVHHKLIDDPYSTVKSYPVAFGYRLGRWALPFLSGPNRQVAYIAQKILQYDPYHKLWESRLAEYCFWQAHMNGGSTIIRRQIGDIIDALSLPSNERRPLETQVHFEKAMNLIKKHDIITTWDYADKNDLPDLPQHKWLSEWKRRSILIEVSNSQSINEPPLLNNLRE